MKTILYNPIFINPQAYYVFPRLTRYLQPDNESTAEPANYIGTIEVKVIAYGDTTLKRTYTNTDSIDLSEFKNTWIRISLFTKVGSCVLGEWKIGNMESDLPYIDPEVLASLKAVVIVGNKTNNDSDRAVVKNLVDPDNPFVISNAAYTEGSGYADKDSPYYGAFVTDGIDDLIKSTKSATEMLDGSNEVTVVSMIHQIKTNDDTTRNNWFFTPVSYLENRVVKDKIGKTGIYGYTSTNVTNAQISDITPILGDKNDYTLYSKIEDGDRDYFTVEGFQNQGIWYVSSIAWYWTIIANKVLTTDQINQVIAYFNLDRTLKPDILCNTIKQGITNENHAEFGDKLIDYSGNGRDIQLNNISWNKESGINDDGALCLDGVTDYGKAVGLPIYKDYTFIIDREILNIDNIGIIASKSESAEDATKHGAFIFEYLTAPNVINTWSYYKNNTNIANTDFTRGISYQSKYNYNGKILTTGTSEDSDKLYLGTIRDNSDKYGNIAIYFLMSFPYSMNKFLIERQLKKYKAGTLYKDMVEFRPVIKSNIDIKNIVYLDKDSNVVKVGDYISIGSNIKTSITVLDGYKISKVSSTAFNNITIEKSNTDFIYDVIFYGIKKSPQKINLVIEQDSDYVQWNPNIKANVSKYSVTANIRKTDGTTLKLVNGQFYSTSITGNLVLDIVPPYKDSDVVTNVVIDGKSYAPTKDSSGNYYRLEIPLVFPKEINITIQEYVRYEDIVQPYPVLLRFKDENNNEISWGDKIKLGSSITRIGLFNDCNLLKDIYTVSNAKLNGNPLTSTPHVVERQMVFTCTATWIFDDNEPKCILSPRLLRIPNSSYKILGHIPDISGHGNHGKINNSAYAGMSGVNGYPVVFGANKTWANESDGYVTSITSNTIHITNVLNAGLALLYSYVKYNGNLQNIKEIPPFKIEIKGLEGRSKFIYKYLATSDATKETNLYLGNGTHELPKSFLPTEALINNAVVGFSISPIEEGVTNFLSDITIKVLPEYEGAYCLDGVDDSVNIPTTVGGKQVLMKVNWDDVIANAIIYDQRGYPDEFAIYNADKDNSNNPVFAYQARNTGQTYIDGILNSNIKASELKAITHNITITNELSAGVNKSSPVIGSNRLHDDFFANMALYDFMLFDNISTDDKIKELNEYVGIEGNTEWRKTK